MVLRLGLRGGKGKGKREKGREMSRFVAGVVKKGGGEGQKLFVLRSMGCKLRKHFFFLGFFLIHLSFFFYFFYFSKLCLFFFLPLFSLPEKPVTKRKKAHIAPRKNCVKLLDIAYALKKGKKIRNGN